MTGVTHIASLVVRAHPDAAARVADAIGRLAGAEVALTDDAGRIVVTLECADEGGIVDRLAELQQLDGVANASLVYHHADEIGEPETLGGDHG